MGVSLVHYSLLSFISHLNQHPANDEPPPGVRERQKAVYQSGR